MRRQCFGEYCAFADGCNRYCELDKYCKMWKNNMLNFRRKRNLAVSVIFLLLMAWDFKIGIDFLKIKFNSFAVMNFSVMFLFFLALGSSIKSRKKAMDAYQACIGNGRTNHIKGAT